MNSLTPVTGGVAWGFERGSVAVEAVGRQQVSNLAEASALPNAGILGHYQWAYVAYWSLRSADSLAQALHLHTKVGEILR